MKFSIVIEDVDSEKDQQRLLRLMAALTEPLDVMEPETQETANQEEEEDEDDLEDIYVRHPKVKLATATEKPDMDSKPVELILKPFGRTSVGTWKEVLIETAEMMIEAKRLPAKTLYIGRSVIPILSPNRIPGRISVQLSNGLFLDANHSARDILRRALSLIAQCGYPTEALSVAYLPPSAY